MINVGLAFFPSAPLLLLVRGIHPTPWLGPARPLAVCATASRRRREASRSAGKSR
jgi:hypothetical protein